MTCNTDKEFLDWVNENLNYFLSHTADFFIFDLDKLPICNNDIKKHFLHFADQVKFQEQAKTIKHSFAMNFFERECASIKHESEYEIFNILNSKFTSVGFCNTKPRAYSMEELQKSKLELIALLTED